VNGGRKLKTFRGEYPYIATGVHRYLIAPFVGIKQVMTQVYDLLLHMLWLSFTRKRTYNLFAFLFGGIVFCILSLLSYFCRSYDGLFVAGIVGIWLVDYVFAHSEYFHGTQRVTNLLTCHGEGMSTWEQRSPRGNPSWAQFQQNTVSHIEIVQMQIRGGAFQTVITLAWQANVVLTDGISHPIYQSQNAAVAYQQGKNLADYFQVLLKFSHSQGQNRHAAQPLDLHHLHQSETFPQTIQVQSSASQWRIDSRWHRSNSLFLLGQVFEESGFLLFVVVVINLMIVVGKVLAQFLPIGFDSSSLDSLSVSNGAWLSWLLADFDWITVGEFALTILLMVLKGAELSQEEHLQITPEKLQFSLGTQQIAAMATTDITGTFFIEYPQPMILILGSQQAIAIPGLQQSIEFRALLLKLDEAIAQLRSVNL
jgi:hypothetical protein